MKEIDAVIIENPSKETLRHVYEITRRLDIIDRENIRFTRVVAKEKPKPNNTRGSPGSQSKTGAAPTTKTVLKDTTSNEIKAVDKLLNKKPGSLKVIEYKAKNTIIPSPLQVPIKGSSKSQVKTGKTGRQEPVMPLENEPLENTGTSQAKGLSYGPGPLRWQEPKPLGRITNDTVGGQDNDTSGSTDIVNNTVNDVFNDNDSTVITVPDILVPTPVVNPPVNYTDIENLTPGTNMTSEEAGVWTTLSGPITWIQELFKVFIYTALLGSTIDGLIQQAVGVGLPQSMVYLFNAISSISIVFAIFQLLFNRSLGGME